MRPRSRCKGTEALLRACEDQGGHVELRKGGHWALYVPGAPTPVFIPATGSDHRGLRNSRAQLRRAGLSVETS